MFERLLGQKDAKEQPVRKPPNAIDIWGRFKEGSPFDLMQRYEQADMDRLEGAYPLDWSKVQMSKADKPKYGALVAQFGYSKLSAWDVDLSSLILPVGAAHPNQEVERIRRLALLSLFLEYCSYTAFMVIGDESVELSDFLEEFRLSLYRNLFMFESDDSRDSSVREFLGYVAAYRKALSSDERQETKDFLESIGTAFLASIPVINGYSSEQTQKIDAHLSKMLEMFLSALQNTSIRPS